MTAPNYAEMSDAQLNEAAARAMGWEIKRNCLPGLTVWGGLEKGWREFSPSTDHNHAAELSAWFRAKEREAGRLWISAGMATIIDGDDWHIFKHENMLMRACLDSSSRNRPRAETIATLMDCDAMAGK